MRYALLASVFLFLVVPMDWFSPPVYATIYFVDGAVGDDTRSGISADSSWATIQYAIDNVSAGDEVRIYAATYAESLKVTCSGTASERIVFRAMEDGVQIAPAGTDTGVVMIRGDYVTIDGWNIVPGNADASEGCIYFRQSATGIIIRNCKLYGGAAGSGYLRGIMFVDGTLTSCKFQGNILYKSSKGIEFQADCEWVNCDFSYNTGTAITNYTFDFRNLNSNSSGNTVRNNIAVGSSKGFYGDAGAQAAITFEFNNSHGNTTDYDTMSEDDSNLSVDPLFISPGATLYDVRLEDDSPMIGASSDGIDIGAMPKEVVRIGN